MDPYRVTSSTCDMTPSYQTGIVDRFQDDEGIPLFLISLKAGVGLNLTAADTVIHFDPWWNPALEAQATDSGTCAGPPAHQGAIRCRLMKLGKLVP
jgi:hypothetical protein